MGPAYWKLTQALEELFRGESESLGYDVRRYLENNAEDVPDAMGSWVTARLEELFRKREECRAAYWGSPEARNPNVITSNLNKKIYYAEADIIEFCLIFLGAEAGYAETVVRRYFVTQHISDPTWVSNSAKWLDMRSSFSVLSDRAGTPGNSGGQELSPKAAVSSWHGPAQPPGQSPQPVGRAPKEGPQNEGEEKRTDASDEARARMYIAMHNDEFRKQFVHKFMDEKSDVIKDIFANVEAGTSQQPTSVSPAEAELRAGTWLLDDDQRAIVCRAMRDLAFKPNEKFDEGVHSRFVETAKRFVKDDEENAIAVAMQISSEIGVAEGDLSFEQIDQYMRAHPAKLGMSLYMQIFTGFGLADIGRFLRTHPEMLEPIVYKIYVQSVLPILLPQPEPWQIERHLPSGKIEISKDWWFRSDGTCGNEGEAGTWRAADYGQLIVKTNEEFTFIFSDVQPGHFTGTVHQRGSSVAAKTVWWTEAAHAQEAQRRQNERLAQVQEEVRRQPDVLPRIQDEQRRQAGQETLRTEADRLAQAGETQRAEWPGCALPIQRRQVEQEAQAQEEQWQADRVARAQEEARRQRDRLLAHGAGGQEDQRVQPDRLAPRQEAARVQAAQGNVPERGTPEFLLFAQKAFAGRLGESEAIRSLWQEAAAGQPNSRRGFNNARAEFWAAVDDENDPRAQVVIGILEAGIDLPGDGAPSLTLSGLHNVVDIIHVRPASIPLKDEKDPDPTKWLDPDNLQFMAG